MADVYRELRAELKKNLNEQRLKRFARHIARLANPRPVRGIPLHLLSRGHEAQRFLANGKPIEAVEVYAREECEKCVRSAALGAEVDTYIAEDRETLSQSKALNGREKGQLQTALKVLQRRNTISAAELRTVERIFQKASGKVRMVREITFKKLPTAGRGRQEQPARSLERELSRALLLIIPEKKRVAGLVAALIDRAGDELEAHLKQQYGKTPAAAQEVRERLGFRANEVAIRVRLSQTD